jgi:hypothetical protein
MKYDHADGAVCFAIAETAIFLRLDGTLGPLAYGKGTPLRLHAGTRPFEVHQEHILLVYESKAQHDSAMHG